MRPQQADLCLGPQTHCLHSSKNFVITVFELICLKKYLRLVEKSLDQKVQWGVQIEKNFC